MRLKVKVEGLKELDAALAELGRSTAKNVARRTLVKAGQPIAEEARRLVPVNTGALKSSIGVRTKGTNTIGRAEYAATMRAGGTKDEALAAMRRARRGSNSDQRVIVAVGPGKLRQATMQEFGTASQPPQPYLRPAWDANKDKALEIIKTELKVEIEKARQRAARKALKKAKG